LKIRAMFALSVLVLGCTATAQAMPYPYLSGSFGGGTLEMGEVNEVLESQQAAIRAGGYTDITMKKVGAGSEWGFGGGLWLFPALRIGATWSQQHSFLSNRYHSPDHTYFYGEELTFDMAEMGVEAAVRVPQLFGFTFGGSMSRAKADFKLSDGEQTSYSYFGNDAKASKTGRTYGAFAGFEQTNGAGWTGALHMGYRWRNMGTMAIHGLSNDGVNYAEWSGTTPEIDYTGLFVQCQIGYDLFRPHTKFGE
jgi:hypothetical protein